MILSTLIFSLLIIRYHKLTGSVNLRCVRTLPLYATHSMAILIKLLLISFQLNIASPNKVITRYPRFITKLLAKKLCCWHRYKFCPNDVTTASYYKSSTDASSDIFNHHNFISIWKRKLLIAIISVNFTNLLITNLAVKVVLAQ